MQQPSQKGKFKPRKPPAKKNIRPGAATGAPAPAAAAPAPARGGRGGRGRGGGGRGGPRPRHVISQGPAFFGANKPMAAAASGSKSSSTSAAGARSGGGISDRIKDRLQQSSSKSGVAGSMKRERNTLTQEEEIVAVLDEGIGTDVPDKVKSAPKSRRESGAITGAAESKIDPVEQLEPLAAAVYEYDSDSSIDIDVPLKATGIVMPSKKPLTLPFPAAKFPPGVGAPLQLGTTATATAEDPLEATHGSPFVGLANTDDLEQENDTWFLLQLPTRLPALPGTSDVVPTIADSNADALAASEESKVPSTVPLRKDCFDNSLVKANPGKIGKFVVYESGKTVLILTGEDGREYQLDAAEGLSCSFRQQAVLIDDSTKEFVPLGDVGKTVVVTPDIETAFSGSR